MSYKIKYLPLANQDLADIFDFLAEYPQKRLRIFEKLDKCLTHLLAMPKMYPVYEYAPKFRKITLDDYLVFYRLFEDEQIIEIHRILYGKMDIQKYL